MAVSGCATQTESECSQFCESWYDCTTTSGMDPGSGSCDFPDLTRDEFVALCRPSCLTHAAELTTQEQMNAVACLDCLSSQVAPLECTNQNVGEAYRGPCDEACNAPGPWEILEAVYDEPEIRAACMTMP